MSFSWNSIDEREKNKNAKERELKDFLKKQQEEIKVRYDNSIDNFRKQNEKKQEMEDYRKMTDFMLVKG